jgi:DNA-binding HxlR family transcriptional regulator
MGNGDGSEVRIRWSLPHRVPVFEIRRQLNAVGRNQRPVYVKEQQWAARAIMHRPDDRRSEVRVCVHAVPRLRYSSSLMSLTIAARTCDDGGMRDGDITCLELIEDCRLRAATELLTHSWDPVVLAALRDRPLRRHQLRTAIGGSSEKVLTEALRRISDNGLVTRLRYAEAPPRVDYALTTLGESFSTVRLRR